MLSKVTHRSQAVNLIKEDDGWLCLLGFLEQEPELALGFAHPLGQNIGPLAHEEGHLGACFAGGGCKSPCHKSFPSAYK